MNFVTQHTVPDLWNKQFATLNMEDSITKQAPAKEADINVIVKRATQSGELPQVQKLAQYGDFTQPVDLGTAILKVRQAHDAFRTVPAAIRARFNNNPGEFLEFVNNPENKEEMYTMKLATRPPKADTPPTPPTAHTETTK